MFLINEALPSIKLVKSVPEAVSGGCSAVCSAVDVPARLFFGFVGLDG